MRKKGPAISLAAFVPEQASPVSRLNLQLAQAAMAEGWACRAASVSGLPAHVSIGQVTPRAAVFI